MSKCKQVFGCHNCRDEMTLLRVSFKGMKDELHKLEQQLEGAIKFIECLASTDEKEVSNGPS